MLWDAGAWSEGEDAAIRASVYATLEHATYRDPKSLETRPWEPSRLKVGNVVEALRAVVHLPESIDAPCWLDGRPGPAAGEVVSALNGLVHVPQRHLLPHHPHFFTMTRAPFAYQADAPQPARWLAFLDELWPDDESSKTALQQFFGYVLSGRTDLHRILLLIGPSRAGKGVIARVLSALVGRRNVAGPTLASLGTNFGLSPLIGRPLAVIADARLGNNSGQIVERLLSISGEDVLTVDRKYRDPWSGRLPTRFMLISNELPNFGDASGAIANRFLVVALTTTFLGRENTRLTDELLTELPGIFVWALNGLDQLSTEGRFTEPEASKAAVLALRDLVSPLSAFIRDRCVVGPGREVSVTDLYSAWRTWCVENGRERPGSVQRFGRDLLAVVPTVLRTQPRTDEGGRERHYLGIALLSARNASDSVPVRADHLERDGTHTQALSTDQAGRDGR
jgi:putative DNA primase/helicase